ncbi:MAG: hypothetical protein Q8T08_00620 [Ignavibacteria bacterium]|nr:hypothetical protein [Ignavibacteria bacterium]
MKYFHYLKMMWKIPRWRKALIIALVSDILGFTVLLMPQFQWALDAITVIGLLLVLGFNWRLLLALAIELIPVLQLFPAWTLVIIAMATRELHEDENLKSMNKS